jgi:hypothetical protein
MIPDINLGPGDTAPVLEQVLIGPNKADGSPGDPLDLTDATVTFRFQRRDLTEAVVERDVVVVLPQTPGTPTAGKTTLDWLATGGPIDIGDATDGVDFNARYKVVYPSGHQLSIPNGLDAFFGETEIREFLWLRVAADFTPVP